MSMWVESDSMGSMFLKPIFTPECVICGGKMKRIVAKPVVFGLWDKDKTGNGDAHAIDTDFWCPEDGYVEQFGVAVSEEHYNKIMDVFSGN